jgi:hypothetical protein
MSQAAAIIAEIEQAGGITRLQAMRLGIMELSARIGELEARGFVFSRYRTVVATRRGTARVMRYRIAQYPKNWRHSA